MTLSTSDPSNPVVSGADRRLDRKARDGQIAREAQAEPVDKITPQQARRSGEDRRGPLRPDHMQTSRNRLSGQSISQSFRIIDLIAIMGSTAAALGLLLQASPERLTLWHLVPLLFGAVVIVWGLRLTESYGFGQREGLAGHLLRVGAALGLTVMALAVASGPFHPSEPYFSLLAQWFAGLTLVLTAVHATGWLLVSHWRRTGRLTPNVLIVGATGNAAHLIQSAIAKNDIAVLGVFDDRAARVGPKIQGVPVLGDIDALLNHRILPYIDHIVIAVPTAAQNRVRELIRRLQVLPNAVTLFVDLDTEEANVAALSRISQAPLTLVSGAWRDEGRAMVKRQQDIVLGILALLVAAPIMLFIAVAIRLDSPGPILFRQRRYGFNNEQIMVYKFRSMHDNGLDEVTLQQVQADDIRVTRFGRLIRGTSLDELPQLFNVLRGEMSLVGPRPHAIGMKTGETPAAKLVAEYAHRHRMKPGITGWAAINGSRGPVNTPELVRRRVALDVEYIERQSFWLDVYILVMTLPCLLGDSQTVR
jgi:Undecaprenyl-phosphate glucose phosphotransferase